MTTETERLVAELHELAEWLAECDEHGKAITAYDAAAALSQQGRDAEPRISVPRNRKEAVATARTALAYLDVVHAHIDAALSRLETDAALATQPKERES